MSGWIVYALVALAGYVTRDVLHLLWGRRGIFFCTTAGIVQLRRLQRLCEARDLAEVASRALSWYDFLLRQKADKDVRLLMHYRGGEVRELVIE